MDMYRYIHTCIYIVYVTAQFLRSFKIANFNTVAFFSPHPAAANMNMTRPFVAREYSSGLNRIGLIRRRAGRAALRFRVRSPGRSYLSISRGIELSR